MIKPFPVLLFIAFATLYSCKKEESEPNQPPPKPRRRPPVAMKSQTQASTPKKTPPKKKDRTKERSKRLVEQLNRLNQCIYRAVNSLKKTMNNSQVETSHKYFHLKKLTAMCEKNLMNVVQNYPDISLPYQKYFTLAAQTIDTYASSIEYLSLPEDTPGRPLKAGIEKELSETYNKFALQNNDLHGVHILEKHPKQPVSTVDVHTYSDELARLGIRISDLVQLWTMHHSFEKPPGKDRPHWMLYFRREIVAFNFIAISMRKHLRYFRTLNCAKGFAQNSMDPMKLTMAQPMAPKKVAMTKNITMKKGTTKGAKGTPPEKKREYTCQELSAKAKMFQESALKFIKVWATELYNGKNAYPVISPSFATKTKAAHDLLKSSLLVLPKRIK